MERTVSARAGAGPARTTAEWRSGCDDRFQSRADGPAWAAAFRATILSMKLSDGEKLILLMLCEIQEHLKIKDSIDTKLIREAIHSGNVWGIEQAFTGIFHGYETKEEVVRETRETLFMWQRLEQSFQALKPEDKKWLAENSKPFGEDVKFYGWDGNNESEYNIAARFLVENLGSFQHFKDREFNSHMPSLETYRRMQPVFDSMLKQVSNQNFSAEQIALVIAEQVHPSRRSS